MTKDRVRRRFNFWLNINSANEALVADAIDELTKRRKFVTTLRDGIMLMIELRQGKTDLLFELFPWIKEAIQPPPLAGGNEEIERRLDEIQRLLFSQGGNAGNNTVMSPAGAPKPLGGLRPVTPRRDDDDDVIELKKSDGTESVENFLKSAMALQ